MADPPPYPGAPMWAKAFGIMGIVLLLLGVVSFLAGHGPPGRHMQSGEAGGAMPPSRAAEAPAPPEDGHR